MLAYVRSGPVSFFDPGDYLSLQPLTKQSAKRILELWWLQGDRKGTWPSFRILRGLFIHSYGLGWVWMLAPLHSSHGAEKSMQLFRTSISLLQRMTLVSKLGSGGALRIEQDNIHKTFWLGPSIKKPFNR